MSKKVPRDLCDLDYFIEKWLKDFVWKHAVEYGENYEFMLMDLIEEQKERWGKFELLGMFEPDRGVNDVWKWFDDDYDYDSNYMFDDFMINTFGEVLPLSFRLVMDMVRELENEGTDIMEDYDLSMITEQTIFGIYIHNKLTYGILDEIDDEIRNTLADAQNDYIEAGEKIVRAWKECRYNPIYKMCEKVQIRDLEINCGMTFNEEGIMVPVC